MPEWFEKSGGAWTAEDRRAALAHIRGQWAAVTGDVALAPLAYPPGTPATPLLDDIVAGRGFAGSKTPGHFTAYVSLHLRIHVLLAQPDPDAWTVSVSGWLQDEQSAAHKRLTVAAQTLARISAGEAATLIFLFCHSDLPRVLRSYDRDELCWPYLTISFQNFVRRDKKPQTRWETAAVPLKPSFEPATPSHSTGNTTDEADEPAGGLPCRIQGEIVREFRTLSQQELEKHGGALSQDCAGCLGLQVLQRSYARKVRSDHAVIANELGITEGNCRVLLTRALHRLRAGLARYPIRLEPDDVTWRVRVNRFALWDTVLRISCDPPALATPHVQELRLTAGMDRSIDGVRLRATPYDTSRPTGFVFADAGCSAGESAVATVHLNQVRLTATANGRSAHAWIVIPPRRTAPFQLTISTADPCIIAVRVGIIRGEASVTVDVAPDETEVAVEAQTGGVPGPARVAVAPPMVVGGSGDPIKAMITLGARLMADSAGGQVEGVLAIAPNDSAPALVVTSADPQQVSAGKPRRTDHPAVLEATLKIRAAARKTAIAVVASSTDQHASGSVTVLPPPIVAVRLSEERIRAGESVSGSVQVKYPIVDAEGTAVTLSTKHRGVVFEPARPVIATGSKETSFTCTATSDARKGVASVVAHANESGATTQIEVIPNGIKTVTFEPHAVTGGATAVGTVTCHHPLGETATIRLISSDGLAEIAGACLDIPKHSSRGTFSVNTKPVKRALTVEIIADGLGDRVAGRLQVKP